MSDQSDFKIQTARLDMNPLSAGDLDVLHAIMISRGVRRYLWDDQIIDRQQLDEILALSKSSFAESGFGLWTVSLRENTEVIGFCGFWSFHDPPQLELLYGITEEHWNAGIATEAARAMLAYGFDKLGFERIQASTDFANTASVRVMQKLGMSFHKRENSNGLDTVFYCADHPE